MQTLVLGASTNPARYSNRAVKLLRSYKHEVIAIGRDEGQIIDVPIIHEFTADLKPDTITVYLNPHNQEVYYDKILSANPRRIIFNPGAENEELEKMANEKGIETLEACTLVMLNTGQY